MRNAFFKGHGLGNDYVVLDPDELDFRITPARVRALCDRHTGVGSDGVLVLAPSRRAGVSVAERAYASGRDAKIELVRVDHEIVVAEAVSLEEGIAHAADATAGAASGDGT
jgi:diaminopimelate epimerase